MTIFSSVIKSRYSPELFKERWVTRSFVSHYDLPLQSRIILEGTVGVTGPGLISFIAFLALVFWAFLSGFPLEFWELYNAPYDI